MPDNELSRAAGKVEIAKEKLVQSAPAPMNKTGGEPAHYSYHVLIHDLSPIDPYECTGIGSCIGTDKAEYSPLILKYKSSQQYSPQMLDWHKKAVNGKIERRTVTVMFLDKTTNCRLDFNLMNAWPIAYEGPNLFAQDPEKAYETMTLVYEGIELVKY